MLADGFRRGMRFTHHCEGFVGSGKTPWGPGRTLQEPATDCNFEDALGSYATNVPLC